MKILCPTDFSRASVNAAEWIVKYLDNAGGGGIVLYHSINIHGRAGMFAVMSELYEEKAADDMKVLVERLSKISDKVKFSTHISTLDPKEAIARFANKGKYNFIVMGTKGLTALKNITVGSVTAYLLNHSKVPVLAIPENKDFIRLKSVVIGVDDQVVQHINIVRPLIKMVQTANAKLHMVHVRQRGDSFWQYDPGLDVYFSDLDYEYKSLEYDDSVAETLTEYADDIDADMLVMIHRKRNWLERLFRRSHTKEELFELETPLLVLPG